MFRYITGCPPATIHDSALTITWQFNEPTGTYTSTTIHSLPRINSVVQKEIRSLSEDIHKIIVSTRRDWEEAKKNLVDNNYIPEYRLPHIEPISTRLVKAKIVSREEGTVNLSFLEEYKDLFD